MNYRHVYMLIIEHAKSEEKLGLRKKGNGNYYEKHHILPKSLFPLWVNRKSNLVLLTAREHFFCHQLLVKIYPCYKMAIALGMIYKNHTNKGVFSSREYQKVRETIAYYQSKCKWYTDGVKDYFTDEKPEGCFEGRTNGYDKGLSKMNEVEPWNKGKKGLQTSWCKGKHIDNHWTGRHHTEETKKKISEARLGKEPWNKGKKGIYSKETLESNRQKHLGKKESEETRLKKKLANVGRVWWTNGVEDRFSVECPPGFYKGRTKIKGWRNNNGNQN